MTDETIETPYQTALFKAWEEFQKTQEDERQLTIKKLQLRQTIEALFPLAFPDWEVTDIRNMTLADAIRAVIKSSTRAVSVKEVRGKLQDLGFDLSKYDNPLASIHTATNRMVESEELIWVDDEGKKLSPGPELKAIPESSELDALTALTSLYAGELDTK
jgi:hypothetical protein